MQTISQDGYVEIDEKPKVKPGCPEIRDDLRLVNGCQALDGFEFDDQASVDQKI